MLRSHKIEPYLILHITEAMSGEFSDSDFAQVVRLLSSLAIKNPTTFAAMQELILNASHSEVRTFIRRLLDRLNDNGSLELSYKDLIKIIIPKQSKFKKSKTNSQQDSSEDESSKTLFDAYFQHEGKKALFEPLIIKAIESNDTRLFNSIMQIADRNTKYNIIHKYSKMPLPLDENDFIESYFFRPNKETVRAYEEVLARTGSVAAAYAAIKDSLRSEARSGTPNTGVVVAQQNQSKQDDLQKVAALFADRDEMYKLLGALNKELKNWVKQFNLYNPANHGLSPLYLLHTKSAFPQHVLKKYCESWARANGFRSELYKITGFLDPAKFASILSRGTLFKDNELKGLTHTALAHFWQMWCITEYAKKNPNWLSCSPVELYCWLGDPAQRNWLGTFEFALISKNPKHKQTGSFSNVLTFGAFLTSDECSSRFPVLFGLTIRSEKRKEIAQAAQSLRLSPK